MKNTFETMKNGLNAQTVWANAETKEIVIANRNSFGYNYQCGDDAEFDKKYGVSLKKNQGKGNRFNFYHSQRDIESLGFRLVRRGDKIMWS